jgi:hypothetical protein
MTNGKLKGYDMKDTLRWYTRNISRLSIGNNRMRKNYPIENQGLAQLEPECIRNVISQFPRNARDRSIIDKISWQKPTWFAKETLETGVPTPTTDADNAISPTAIIPGYTGYYLNDAGRLRADIKLYQLEFWIDPVVRQAVQTEAVAHEYAHTVIAPSLYGNQNLELPDGTIVNGEDFLMNIGMKAEKRIPISNYAEVYRDFSASEGLPYKIMHGDKKTAISEELAETIAAIVLPFALHNPQNISIRNSHLANRREIVRGLEDFLNARKVR